MSRTEVIFLTLVFLLGGLWETKAVSVTGEVGEKVMIKCSHTNAFFNVKYFCKGACNNEDVLIRSTGKKSDQNEKYSIVDEGNTFFVTMSHLTKNDSGTYYCGIDRFGVDTYKKVVLTVTVESREEPDNDFKTSPPPGSNDAVDTTVSSTKRLVYTGAGLGVVVLVLAMVSLIFFRHRSRDIHASSGKTQDTVYATQDGHHLTSLPSAVSEAREADVRTNSTFSWQLAQHRNTSRHHTDNIYSNITDSSEPPTQPDGLLYSSVVFRKHTDCSTVSPHSAVVTYSTLKHKSTDESTDDDKV